MHISVAERVAEIGLLNALGVTRTRICLLFLLEPTLLSTLCRLAELAIGTLIAALLKIVASSLPVSVPWKFVMCALALSVVIDLAAGVVPAIRASRLNPIDALRTE